MRRAGMLETRRLLAFEMGCEMTSARRSKSLAAALFAAALTLAVTVATATAFAEASPQDNAAGPAFAPGTMTAADGEETIDSDCVPGDKLDGVKVRFRPAGSHKPVSVEDDGDGDQEDLILYYLGESTHFRLEKADGDSYKIRFFQDYANQDVKRKKAQILDVERNNNDDQTYYREGQNIHMVSGDGDALNKRWQFLQQPDGTYYIRNKRTQLYWSLEDLNKPKSNNNKIVQRKTPMKWELELVSTRDFSVDKMAEIKHYDSLNFALGGETVTSLDWMSFLPDSAYITDISIPGTHDAAMARLDTSAGKESRRTQQYYIDEMLAAGVRHFDTRLGLENGTITLVHSSDADALDHDGNDLTFATLLSWVSGFLDKHPDETVIMQIMADEKESEVERAALAWINNFIRNDEEGDLIWVGDHVPTLGEVRGKVVIVSRFNNVVKEDSSDFYIPGRGYWALDVGGWRQSDTYPVYEDYPLSPTIHSSAQPYQSLGRWDDCEVWVQDSYSHTPHETTFKSSKKPYIVGSIDGIVYDYFDLPETFLGKKGYPEGTYGTEYRRAEALKKGKHAWVFNFLNCSANGLGYHYRGNAKEIHQWIYDNDWIIRDDMFTGVVGIDYVDELMANKVYRTNFAGGTGGWGDTTYEWSADNTTCTASRTWTGGAGFVETETATAKRTVKAATCTEPGSTEYVAEFENDDFAPQTKSFEGAPALGHRWDAGVITKKRTCAEDGVRTYTCKRCGTTRTEALPATGHSPAEPVIENEVSATCVKAGSFDEVVYCMSCDKELSRTAKTLPIDPNAHEWAVLDGCDADGWKASQVGDMITERRECKNDPSHFETRTFEVDHVHDYRLVPVQPASCTHAGVKEHDVCATCGHVFRVNDEGTREETTLAALAIPAAHTPGEPEREDVSAPTCAEPGEYDMVLRCEDCGAELSREHVAIEPLGHDWGAAAYEWSDDLGSCTATRTCNRGEPHVQVAPGSVTFEMTKEPTATEPGERTYTATFDVDWAQTQTATSGIPPTGEDAIAYQATKGGGAWTKGSGDKLSFTYQRSQQNDLTFSLFTGVLVDGQEVPQGSYDAYSGSVVIELSPNYLETLAVGAHTLQPTFQDGVGDEVSFTIAEAVKPDEGGEVKPDEGGSVKPDDKGGSKVDGNGNGDGGSSGGTAASTKPASSTSKGSAASAKTGDALPIAAVCILVVLGLVVAIVAYRKSRK